VPRLERLAAASRLPGCKKLKGDETEWEIRIGDYRIVYVIDHATNTVDVTRLAHLREVYE